MVVGCATSLDKLLGGTNWRRGALTGGGEGGRVDVDGLREVYSRGDVLDGCGAGGWEVRGGK